MRRRFSVIAANTEGARNVKRLIQRLDKDANVLRLGCRLDFWTESDEITTATFRTMSYVDYAMITDEKEKKKSVSQI